MKLLKCIFKCHEFKYGYVFKYFMNGGRKEYVHPGYLQI